MAVGLALAAAGCPVKKKGGGSPELKTFDVRSDQYLKVDNLQPGIDQFAMVRRSDGIFTFSLGLTPPIDLLPYRHADNLPSYCRRDAILDRLSALAESRQCSADSLTVGGTPTRIIICRLARERTADTCPSEYVAHVWQERWPGSTEDYDLEMYARVRTACSTGEQFRTFHAPEEIIREASKRTDEVKKLLDSCKQPERR